MVRRRHDIIDGKRAKKRKLLEKEGLQGEDIESKLDAMEDEFEKEVDSLPIPDLQEKHSCIQICTGNITCVMLGNKCPALQVLLQCVRVEDCLIRFESSATFLDRIANRQKPRTREILLLFPNYPKGSFICQNHQQFHEHSHVTLYTNGEHHLDGNHYKCFSDLTGIADVTGTFSFKWATT